MNTSTCLVCCCYLNQTHTTDKNRLIQFMGNSMVMNIPTEFTHLASVDLNTMSELREARQFLGRESKCVIAT